MTDPLGHVTGYPEAFKRTASTLPLALHRVGRIYIAGPMTGLPDLNFPAFNDKARELREFGWHVENPAEHGVVDGATWADYLLFDLGRLATCSTICLLPGWSRSEGARLEMDVARRTGLDIRYSPGAERAALDQGSSDV